MSIINSKKFLSALFISYIVSLLGYPLAFAQMEACAFSDYEIEGVEVGQIGDRQIYTLFTEHPFTEDREVHEILESHEPEDAVAPLNQIIEKYQAIIESEQSDAEKILELAKSGKIDWIGIEAGNRYTSYTNATDNHLNDRDFLQYSLNYLDNLDSIGMRFNHLPDWDASKTDQLLFLLHPARAIVRANHPGVFRRVRLYPLEDRNLIIETITQLNSFFYWKELVKKDVHVTPYQHSQIISFINDHISPPRSISRNVFEDLLEWLRIRSEALRNIRRLRVINNNIVSLILKRDEAVVQSILELPGNGLITFGTAHGPGIKQGLITACQNGNGSP